MRFKETPHLCQCLQREVKGGTDEFGCKDIKKDASVAIKVKHSEQMGYNVRHVVQAARASVSVCCQSTAPESLQRRCQIASAVVTIQTCIVTGYLLSQPTHAGKLAYMRLLVYMFVLTYATCHVHEYTVFVCMFQLWNVLLVGRECVRCLWDTLLYEHVMPEAVCGKIFLLRTINYQCSLHVLTGKYVWVYGLHFPSLWERQDVIEVYQLWQTVLALMVTQTIAKPLIAPLEGNTHKRLTKVTS